MQGVRHYNARLMTRTSSSTAQLQLFEAQDVAQQWNIRVSRRARRLSVRVYPGGKVEVVVPPGASPATVERFVGTHRSWIDDRVADLSAISAVAAETRPISIVLSAVGRSYVLEYRRTAASDVQVTPTLGNTLLVAGAIDNEQRLARAIGNSNGS
jgi:predicted metal-dependent hydrolase